MIKVHYCTSYDYACGNFGEDYLFPERSLANKNLFDWAVKKFVEHAYDDDEFVIITTSEHVIAALRWVVLNDWVMPDNAVIRYEEHIIHMNTYGVILHYPDGFTDFLELLEDDIFKLALAKHKRNTLGGM
jgi:hypothetical protein